jgi:hypothetical protein
MLSQRQSLFQRTREEEFWLDFSNLFYRDLSAYRPIPQCSFHSRRLPKSERLGSRIRQILSVQDRHSILFKSA